MSPGVLLTAIFAATFTLVVLGLYVATTWFKVEIPSTGEGVMSGEDSPILLRTENISSITFWAELLERFTFAKSLRRLMSEAGLSWSVGRFTMMMLLAGASIVVILSRINWLPTIAVGMGGVVGMLAPFFYVSSKRTKRFEQFELHFPDALDSLGRAMRAGHALAAGMEMVANEAAQPVGGEFRRVVEEWKLGRSWDQALQHLSERMPLVSVSLFVAAIRMQSRTGGKLHEVLARVSDGLRDSTSLDGEIRAIGAHGKLTGLVLTAVPIVIVVMLQWTSPGYLDILTDHPIGKYLIVAALCFLVAAHFVIQKILDIKI